MLWYYSLRASPFQQWRTNTHQGIEGFSADLCRIAFKIRDDILARDVVVRWNNAEGQIPGIKSFLELAKDGTSQMELAKAREIVLNLARDYESALETSTGET